jgi:hypothetical protein
VLLPVLPLCALKLSATKRAGAAIQVIFILSLLLKFLHSMDALPCDEAVQKQGAALLLQVAGQSWSG